MPKDNKFIQKAIKRPGALRTKAKARGMISGDQKLSHSDLETLAKSKNPRTRRQANFAMTLNKLRK